MDDDGEGRFADGLWTNEVLAESLRRVFALALPDWYLGAGCISQTLWNIAHAEAPTAHILDYDLVYYDPDLSMEAERDVEDSARELLADLPLELDVKNQARVHLWYPDRFGYNISQYQSVEDAIGTWPTTATAVGVRLSHGELDVFAPFGLEDLLNLIVRANRVQVTRDIFEMKAARWQELWPTLRIIPWDEGIGAEGERHLSPAVNVTIEYPNEPHNRRVEPTGGAGGSRAIPLDRQTSGNGGAAWELLVT